MKVETYLNPNCSELGLEISNNPSKDELIETIKTIRKNGLKVCLTLSDKSYYKLSAETIALIKLKKDESLTNTDRLQLIKELQDSGMSSNAAKKLALALPEDPYSINVEIGKKRSWVSLIITDPCSGAKGIIFETGDGETTAFNTMLELETIFGGEIYGIDGGHPETYEEWKGEIK